MPEITNVEHLYETLLENLRGFDLDEVEDMDRDALLAHWDAACHAFAKLDDALVAGEELPLDWQPSDDAPVTSLPRPSAAQSA